MNLLEQVCWRNVLYCPHYEPESVIKHGGYRQYKRYPSKGCDHTFNPKASTILARAEFDLSWLLFAI